MDFKQSLSEYLSTEEVNRLMDAIENGPVSHGLLLNTKKMSDEEFVKRFPHVRPHPFVKHAYLYDKDEYEFGKSILYDDGVYSIEDPSAMMNVFFLNPQEDDLVLDICAAPGGKSIGASLAMNDKGTIVANDISYPRAKAMSQNVERMGRGNIIVASNDFVFSHVHFQNFFDKIIVDAPCSGSAMMRKNEEAKKDWKIEKVRSNAKRQLDILELAYSMLKEGGTISYSTCSFNFEEDEGTILGFKKLHPEIELVNLMDDPSFYRSEQLKEAVRFFPSRFEGEGQFVCLFKKPGVLTKNKKTIVSNERYKDFIAQYGLTDRSNELMRGKFYSLYEHFDVTHLNILRYGVKLFEMRDIYIPDHHLSHYLDASYSWPITIEEARAYVHGDVFPCTKADGYYIVSYDSQNLGYVKVTQGVAKNHYPKGLRREWKD
jgi:16S rRNA C967 or C1407 C5-methylase (RsmB/RsmF family)/NOL1/NOP2/fmu family ribosome biogenesis protein